MYRIRFQGKIMRDLTETMAVAFVDGNLDPSRAAERHRFVHIFGDNVYNTQWFLSFIYISLSGVSSSPKENF
jgi:hypothetical protein